MFVSHVCRCCVLCFVSVSGGVTLLFVKRCMDRGEDTHPASRSMASALCHCSEGRLQMGYAFFGLFHESLPRMGAISEQ